MIADEENRCISEFLMVSHVRKVTMKLWLRLFSLTAEVFVTAISAEMSNSFYGYMNF